MVLRQNDLDGLKEGHNGPTWKPALAAAVGLKDLHKDKLAVKL